VTPAFWAALDGAGRIAGRLRRSVAGLAPRVPFDGAAVAGMDEATQDATDAFLKRFESLVAQLQDQVWRHALIALDENPEGLSRRDLAERMEKLGLLASAPEFGQAAFLRNRLSHTYPGEPERLARRLNEALALAPVLLRAVEAATAWAARRGASAS
jgi:hypothetical protein